MLTKESKQRLVKYLEKKSPDAIARIVKEKNLGPILGKDRAIKTLGGKGEGIAELVGDPKRGVNVRKFVDAKNSPLTSVNDTLTKSKELRILNKDPRTKNDFVELVPGSTRVGKNRDVVSVNTSYSPGLRDTPDSDEVSELLNQRKRQEVSSRAQEVLGRPIHDIMENPGNFNDATGEVVDFISDKTVKEPKWQTYIRSLNAKFRGAKNKDHRTEAQTKEIKDGVLSRIRSNPELNAAYKETSKKAPSALKRESPGNFIMGKDQTLAQKNALSETYEKGLNEIPIEKRLKDLKKRFYASKDPNLKNKLP